MEGIAVEGEKFRQTLKMSLPWDGNLPSVEVAIWQVV